MKRAIVITAAVLSILTVWAAFAAEVRAPDTDPEITKYLALAEKQRAAGAYGSAIRCYRRVLEKEDSPEYRLLLAEAYRLNGDRKLYEEALEDLIRIFPGTLEAYEKLAEHHYAASDYTECAEVARKAGREGLRSEKLDGLFYSSAYRFSVADGRFDDAGVFRNGLAVVKIGDACCYVNKSMDIIGGAGYESADVFFGNAAAVRRDGEACFIDRSGRKYLVPDGEYDEMWSYSEGKAAVMRDGEYGYINIFGERVPGNYLYASSYQGGLAAVKDEKGWKMIDSVGSEVTGERYEDIKLGEDNTVGHGGIFFAKKDGRWHMKDSEGKTIGNMEYEDARPFTEDRLTAVKLDGLWGFADLAGNIEILPRYEDARPFSEGLAAVRVGGLWGFIDHENVMVIDCVFEDAKCFSADLAAPVKKDGFWTYILLSE